MSEKPELPRQRWWHDAPETWTQRVQPAQPVQTPAATPDPVPNWSKQQPASPMELFTEDHSQTIRHQYIRQRENVMNYWSEWEGFGQEYPDQVPQPEEQKQPG
jgi:hypothetical protein